MALSYQSAVSDGSLTTLSLSIDYLDRDDISVTFDGLPDPTAWSWGPGSSKVINFSPAVPNGVEVRVIRDTPTDAPLHNFSGGAPFLEESMDENFMQVLYIAQEAREQSRVTDLHDDLDMHGFRIQFLGDAVDPGDAVPLHQVEDLNQQLRLQVQGDLQQQAQDVEQFAIRAEQAEQGAQTQAGNASSSAGAAAGSALAASGSASTAQGYATASGLSEGLAGLHANAAELAKIDAEAAAVLAQAAKKDILNHYYGGSAVVPSTRPDGTARQQGDMYFNTTQSKLFVWTGVQWASPDLDVDIGAGALLAANNLSDLTNPANARNNLQLGSAAEADSSDFVPAGDPALSDAREWTAGTISKADAEAGTSTARQAWTAERVKQAILALTPPSSGGDMLGSNNLSDLTNAATARTNLGLTALATASEGAFGGTLRATANAASARTALQLTPLATAVSTAFGRGLVNAADASAVRTSLGLSDLATLSGSTNYGKGFLSLADASAARAYVGLETVSQVEAEAGSSNTARAWSAARVKQAIEALSPAAPGLPTQQEAEAGTATTARTWSAQRVAQAIAALGLQSNLVLLKAGNLSGLASTSTARANLGLSTVSQAVAEAGTSTNTYSWTPARVKQAITYQVGGMSIDPVKVTAGTGAGEYGFRAGSVLVLKDHGNIPPTLDGASSGFAYDSFDYPAMLVWDHEHRDFWPGGVKPAQKTWRQVHSGSSIKVTQILSNYGLFAGYASGYVRIGYNGGPGQKQRLVMRSGSSVPSEVIDPVGNIAAFYSDGYVSLGGDDTVAPPPITNARFPRIAQMVLRGTVPAGGGNVIIAHGLTGTSNGRGPEYRILSVTGALYASGLGLPVQGSHSAGGPSAVNNHEIYWDNGNIYVAVPAGATTWHGAQVRLLVTYQAAGSTDSGW